MKRFLIILSLFFTFISQCVFEVTASEQYAYPVVFEVEDGGDANVAIVCNIDRTDQEISFKSWGGYSVSLKPGHSITLNSRAYENLNNKIKITCRFTVTNDNTHQTKTYEMTETVIYEDVSSYHNFG